MGTISIGSLILVFDAVVDFFFFAMAKVCHGQWEGCKRLEIENDPVPWWLVAHFEKLERLRRR
jgi:hypothetical protein